MINIKMSWAVIYDWRNFPTLNIELRVKPSRIIRKNLELVLTRKAFDTFETSWFFCLSSYQHG